MHVIFNGDNLSLDLYYRAGAPNQVGGAFTYFTGQEPFQRGYGFLFARRQRGGGVGSAFKGLWRYLLPLIKSSGAAVGKEGLSTASRILSNITHGTNMKDAIINETAAGARNLADQVKERGVNKTKEIIDQMQAGLLQKGTGKRRRTKTTLIPPNRDLIGRTVPPRALHAFNKRQRHDSLGYY
jgi:hypothetical protein